MSKKHLEFIKTIKEAIALIDNNRNKAARLVLHRLSQKTADAITQDAALLKKAFMAGRDAQFIGCDDGEYMYKQFISSL